MAEVASAFVSILPSARGFGRKLEGDISGDVDRAGKQTGSRFGAAIGTGAKAGLLLGGAALTAFAASTIGAASEAQQSLGATETVFGRFAKTVVGTSNQAAQQFGLSANTYRENANLLGSLFKNQGVATEDLAAQTKNMIGVGADLAATFGGTTTEAVETLGAAFKGEYDSIERYGISLKESTVSALLAKRGQDKLTGASLAAAKQQAVTDLIMRQSKDSLGAFGRESSTLAGQQQRLGAQFENIKATLGTALLPVLTQFAAFLNSSVLPGFTAFINGMRNGTGAGGQFAAVLSTVASAVQAAFGFISVNAAPLATFAGTILTVVTAVKIWTAAQLLLNLAMTANPIGIVVVALAALAAGLVYAYNHSETFRNIVNAAFAAVRAVVGAVVGWLSKYVPQVFSAVVSAVRTYVSTYRAVVTAAFNAVRSVVTTSVNAVRLVVTTNWNAIRTITTTTWNAAKAIVTTQVRALIAAANGIASLVGKIRGWFSEIYQAIQSKLSEAVAFVRTFPGKVLAVFSGLGQRLYNAGAEMMNMLASGIRDRLGAAYDALKSAASKLASLVPGSPVKDGPLRSLNNGHAGGKIMEMVAKGIADNDAKPSDAMKKAMEKVRDRLIEKRDEIKSVLDGLKSDFASLSESVANAFTGNLFDAAATEGTPIEAGASYASAAEAMAAHMASVGKSAGQNFIDNLLGTRSQLKGLMSAFKRLVKWGLSPQFLSQLFASGNGGLILDLAGSRGQAKQAQQLFGQVNSLSSQLGNQVARNDLGPRIDKQTKVLEDIRHDIRLLDKRIGGQINNAAAAGARGR